MSSKFLVGACIALGILGTWNTWTLYQVNQRLEVIEAMSTSEANNSSRLSDISNAITDYRRSDTNIEIQRKRKYKSANKSDTTDPISASKPTAIDLSDPEIQKTIANIAESNAQEKERERRQSKMEAYKTSVKYELESFAEEKDYDPETVQSIASILDNSSDEWRAVREQVQEGEISWIDARTEFKAIGEETEQKVTEFISEEDYKELQGRLWGDWGR